LQEYQVKGDEEEGQTWESEIASTTSYATMLVSIPPIYHIVPALE
jgi:hypothetical protein